MNIFVYIKNKFGQETARHVAISTFFRMKWYNWSLPKEERAIIKVII